MTEPVLPYRVWYRYSRHAPWLRVYQAATEEDGQTLLRGLYRWRIGPPGGQGCVLPDGVHPDRIPEVEGKAAGFIGEGSGF